MGQGLRPEGWALHLVETPPLPVRPTPTAVPRVDNVVLGILFMITAPLLFAGTAAPRVPQPPGLSSSPASLRP
jgi:hypothetical protein